MNQHAFYILNPMSYLYAFLYLYSAERDSGKKMDKEDKNYVINAFIKSVKLKNIAKL